MSDVWSRRLRLDGSAADTQALKVVIEAFAGANMLQAAFTRLCPAAMVFKALGVKQGCAFK